MLDILRIWILDLFRIQNEDSIREERMMISVIQVFKFVINISSNQKVNNNNDKGKSESYRRMM